MAGLSHLDSLVTKQLAKLGLSPDRPPSGVGWQKFLDRVSLHYQHADRDRSLLARSLDLSSREMATLQARLAKEHDRLRHMIAAISHGLRGFYQVIERVPHSPTDDDVSEITRSIRHARDQLSQQLSEPFDHTGVSSWSAEEAARIRHDFLFMSDQLLQILHTTVQRATVHKDLEVADAVRQLLIPQRQDITRQGIAMAGLYRPAAHCGGDWWSIYDLPERGILAVIGDVSGKGVAQAIIIGVAKAACDVAHLLGDEQVTCTALLDMLNSCIWQAAQQTLFMTCIASEFDPDTRTLTVANAGHSFPLIVRRDGSAPPRIESLPAGIRLGASHKSLFQTHPIEVRPGDVIVWYTDGITASQNRHGDRFDRRHLKSVVERVASSDPARVRDSIMEEVAAFCGHDLLGDDATLIVACISS
ncbi:MAG: serine/threonine-protein phosphatase [Proteobacteria bacterium]|nr:serine/threonine-protein phosphatase [Pseudomonadota bacterium]